MASPAETHDEVEAEKREAARLDQLKRRQKHLIAMLHDVGFGSQNSGNHLEQMVYERLNESLTLIDTEIIARDK